MYNSLKIRKYVPETNNYLTTQIVKCNKKLVVPFIYYRSKVINYHLSKEKRKFKRATTT